ncbi:MAG: helix-turn-helix domain-containing protein [Actinophytocola sp.]|uniref:IclR family transcriptional regulator n=1 Tax=Actinophytocola sp. TaxID=1872138 RepID=UPI00132B4D92|nr:IclR family transcriptional regulator [Actinophytocola sp.]MPZ83072.1 helix-turn-helix domain-containing protein [Actinophytocola sp.]
MTEDAPARQSVQAIDRAVAIMSVFSRARPVAGVSEIATLTSLSRSTVHRILASLANHGLVTQLPRSTDYSLGPRLIGLAETARQRLSMELQAEPAMTALRDVTGETVALHILDATPARRTLAQVESVHALRRTYTDIGAPLAPHQGAPGKVLLAFADEVLQERVLRDDLRSAVTLSKIDVDALRAELAEIRAKGYALSLEERVPGVVGVAVPVRDHTGVVVAALSVSVPALRAGVAELEAIAPRAKEAADELSAQLGYRPD